MDFSYMALYAILPGEIHPTLVAGLADIRRIIVWL
jgi:hypothetical protein